MGNWHIVFIVGWAVVIWYSISALLSPTKERESESLPYIAELLALASIFLIVYSLQEIVSHFYAWKEVP
jgi:hypothetical protein